MNSIPDILMELDRNWSLMSFNEYIDIEDKYIDTMIQEEIGSLFEDKIGGYRKNSPKSKEVVKVVRSKGNKRDKAKLREEKRGYFSE